MGLSKAKMCYVITTKAEEISEYLISHSPRGVTLINGEGMYSKQPRGILLTCVKSHQIEALKIWLNNLTKALSLSFAMLTKFTEKVLIELSKIKKAVKNGYCRLFKKY